MSALNMLNLGCGSRYQPEWVNVNFNSTGDGVIAANLNVGIPFPDESFDFVYHSHLLEHFTKSAAVDFLKECHRVLRPNGILRVVLPDLEEIARNYLLALENARAGIKGWDHNYDWMMLELYDQVARNQPGGEMLRFLQSKSLANEQFVIDRCGIEVRDIIETGRQRTHITITSEQVNSAKRRRIFGLWRRGRWKEKLLMLLLGDDYDALRVGRFRLSGENHQWMYDSYSLGKQLTGIGFTKVVVRKANESYLTEWPSYNLDTEPDGSVYKPDSLFMEAIKP